MKPDYLIHDRQYKEARAKGWNGWGGNDRIAYEQRWIELLFSYREIPKMGDVLELGCGEGHISRLLAEKGYRVLGVDISPTAIKWAGEKTLGTSLPIEYLEIDLTQPDVLLGKTFDLIVDGNCLHCIIGEDRKVFLSNVFRLLKNSGLFFVFSKCSYSGENEIIDYEGKPYRFVPNRESLQSELKAAGFEIREFVFHPEQEGQKYGHCTVHLVRH